MVFNILNENVFYRKYTFARDVFFIKLMEKEYKPF